MSEGLAIGITLNLIFSLFIIPVFLGQERKIGYLWSMLACVFLTPIIGLFITLLSQKIKISERDEYDKIESLRELLEVGLLTKEEFEHKRSDLINTKIKSKLLKTVEYKHLKKLYEEGVLTEQEFNDKVNIVKSKIV